MITGKRSIATQETLYLLAVPGMRESIKAGMAEPLEIRCEGAEVVSRDVVFAKHALKDAKKSQTLLESNRAASTSSAAVVWIEWSYSMRADSSTKSNLRTSGFNHVQRNPSLCSLFGRLAWKCPGRRSDTSR
jgi:hypothetical protein